MYQLIVLLPLLGALIAGLFGTALPRAVRESVNVDIDTISPSSSAAAAPEELAHQPSPTWPGVLTSALLLVTAVLSWIIFLSSLHGGDTEKINFFPFIHSGELIADWSLRIDALTRVMLVVVTTVSSLVHVYSIGYMGHDPSQGRFFAYLSLFTFAMLALVTADNLVQLFFGWEGVGLASYLLIGFWYHRPAANAAAIKAFIVNRVGDFGFALGIFGCFAIFGSIDLDTIFNAAPEQLGKTMMFLGFEVDVLTALCLLLFMGAMGKSAQFLLHTWLPDAMEGPTPVSALIHAATMVTAGVFLVARLSPLYELAPNAQAFIALTGAVTAFFAGTVALVQNDIKRVIAYSTCSQLGYMFVAMGFGAYGVGMFHLFTHAFFKALLFLAAGSVIHALAGDQDMRRMGGLHGHLRITWTLMLIGTLALTGFPLTAGYFSKDAVIEAAFVHQGQVSAICFWLLLISALFTAFYSWRLMFLTFHGSPRAAPQVMEHAHESPPVMLVPLYPLAAGSLFAGMLFYRYFIGDEESLFWSTAIYRAPENEIIHHLHETPFSVRIAPFFMLVAGFAIAYLFYILRPGLPKRFAEANAPIYKFLLNKWYFDELYELIFVRPGLRLAHFLWQKGDGWLIDGFGPDGISARVLDVTRNVVRLQSGYLYHYAFAMLIGVAALVTWYMFAGGR
ncbi:MAG TPA: NADH-quinone oxidoreductase subunit L [Aestuariivirgaceae bacterium]